MCVSFFSLWAFSESISHPNEKTPNSLAFARKKFRAPFPFPPPAALLALAPGPEQPGPSGVVDGPTGPPPLTSSRGSIPSPGLPVLWSRERESRVLGGGSGEHSPGTFRSQPGCKDTPGPCAFPEGGNLHMEFKDQPPRKLRIVARCLATLGQSSPRERLDGGESRRFWGSWAPIPGPVPGAPSSDPGARLGGGEARASRRLMSPRRSGAGGLAQQGQLRGGCRPGRARRAGRSGRTLTCSGGDPDATGPAARVPRGP